MHIALKTKKCLKTHAYNIKNAKDAPQAGVTFVAVRAPSVEEHLSHAPTQLRTHARTHARHEHETKPKPISRLGSAAPNKPPNLQLCKRKRGYIVPIEEIYGVLYSIL